MLSPEVIDCTDDNGIEVIEEIPPGINRNQVHARKTLYHSGHVSNSNIVLFFNIYIPSLQKIILVKICVLYMHTCESKDTSSLSLQCFNTSSYIYRYINIILF